MSETGDQEKGDNGSSGETDKSFNLKLRPPLFNYIADGLVPVYAKELGNVRQNGSHEDFGAFEKSTFALLMKKIMKAYREEAEQAETVKNVEISLSQRELDLIIGKIPEETGPAESRIRLDMMSELRNTFNSAKLDAGAGKVQTPVLGLVRSEKMDG